MRNILSTIAVFACVVSYAGNGRTSGPGSFTFVQVSDPQLGFFEHPYGTFVRTEKMLNHVVDELNASRPAFVIMTGDMCDQAALETQYEAYKSAMGRLSDRIPVYCVPGNHDIEGGYTDEKLQGYIAKYGPEKFSFKYKGCSFIGFDSNCIRDDAAEAEALQYSWLRQQLTAAQGSRFIFVFCHCPVFWGKYDQPEDYSNFPLKYRQKYLDLFNEFGVTVVFAGHTHHPMCTEYKGTYYSICGSSGTSLEESPSGYHVVTVGRKGYEIEFKAIENQEK